MTGVGPAGAPAEESDGRDLRRLEQLMTYVRWFAAAGGAAVLATGTTSSEVETGRWILIVCLTVGSLIVWGLSGRATTSEDLGRLGIAAFAFDTAIVAAFAWLFALGEPGVVTVALLVLPVEGALRYSLKGAIAGALTVVGLAALPQLRTLIEPGVQPDIADYLLAVASGATFAALTGWMAESWDMQSREARAKSRQLEEFDRMKDRFLAVTSHEIRGPVTAIIAGIDTVRRKSDRLTPEQTKKLLEMVADQGLQLARLVDDLLVTSQLQTGKLALQAEWVDLQSTISHALEGAAGKRRAHNVEVFVEPIRCEIDPARVGQIVRNLVENAYKYTPDDSTVRISAKRINEGIRIEVADNGDGIPEGKRDQLFEAFSRIAETSAGREGVGLGLYVVSHLTAAMGGRIDLASSSQGTTFTIDIPCGAEPIERRVLNVLDGEP